MTLGDMIVALCGVIVGQGTMYLILRGAVHRAEATARNWQRRAAQAEERTADYLGQLHRLRRAASPKE